MKSKLIYFGNPLLRKKCQPVESITPEIKEIVAEMIILMNNHRGIGLSANQAGYDLRIFISQVPIDREDGEYEDGDLLVFINPKLSNPGEEYDIRDEGCLSIPGLYVPVARPLTIEVEALDLEGKPFKIRCSGYQARCCMHENDHINGVLMVDRTDPRTKKQIDQRLKEIKKKFKES
jgi:peptide deformylase